MYVCKEAGSSANIDVIGFGREGKCTGMDKKIEWSFY